LPDPSFLKAHFIQLLAKEKLINRLPRAVSGPRMRELVMMVRRAIDPDAPFTADRQGAARF
jgi:hypothetical protein